MVEFSGEEELQSNGMRRNSSEKHSIEADMRGKERKSMDQLRQNNEEMRIDTEVQRAAADMRGQEWPRTEMELHRLAKQRHETAEPATPA